MKKILFVAVISLLALAGAIYLDFTKPSDTEEPIRNYDNGYEEGKEIGYDIGYEAGYDAGYDAGRDTGYEYAIENCMYDDEIIWRIGEDASGEAQKISGWSPEEAVWIIEAYQNRDAMHQDCAPPSYEDYLDALKCLIEFYYYFD